VCAHQQPAAWPVDSPINLLAEVLSPTKIEELEDVGELNMAIPIDGVGNFRISAMRQRGSYAAVIRYIAP
jgi:twitching motility protein PilU